MEEDEWKEDEWRKTDQGLVEGSNGCLVVDTAH